MINKILNWMIDSSSNKPDWRNPCLIIGAIGAWLMLLGIPTMSRHFYNGLSMLIVGGLMWVLLVLAALNYECEQFGNHQYLKKKIF